MHCHVANNALSGEDGGFPNVPPTHKLSVEQLVAVAKGAGFGCHSTAFLVTKEALAAVYGCPLFPTMSPLFYFMITGQLSRFDWVITGNRGEWVEVEPGAPEYDLAPFEDAFVVNKADPRECAMLRYRRVVDLGNMEFSE